MKSTLIGILLAVLGTAASVANEPPTFPIVTGKLSTVRVLEIRRLSSTELAQCPGADDGMLFTFQIISRSSETGLFSLAELRDFTIDGESYRSMTSRPLEPETTVDDSLDYVKERRPAFEGRLGIPPKTKDVVMIAAIYGRRLPATGAGVVTVDTGWNEKTEKLTHRFRLEDTMPPDSRRNEKEAPNQGSHRKGKGEGT